MPLENYVLLAPTNVGTPTTSWTVLETNQFDAGGNFSFTNAINPARGQSYYIPQTQ
ncbi:MAG TPA: hypothetical protein VH619_17010 [Verrucomicrobiae bacterium]|nr:hypothetical protein [Verrucomicrobiae bacterium]